MTQRGVYIGLGSNLGDRRANLDAAVEALRTHPQVEVVKVSRWIETDPVGGPPQGKFLNGVVEVATDLTSRGCLDLLLEIERRMGRERRVRWGPRTIDLDLLLWGDDQIDEPGLRVPHPRMGERSFVLGPLAEISPGAARRASAAGGRTS